MNNPLLRPQNLKTAATIDKAKEVLKILLESEDGDEIADAMEMAINDTNLGHAVMMELVMVSRGWEDDRSGVQRIAAALEPEGRLYISKG